VWGETGEDERRFHVLRHGHSYSTTSPITTFELELEETEEVLATRLVLDSRVSMTPDRYLERLDEGALVIEALVSVSGDNDAALEALIIKGAADREARYFPVIREGVQDEARPMRFGRCLWSKGEGDVTRHLLVLVDQSIDERDDSDSIGRRVLTEPQLTRALEAIVQLQAQVAQLVDRLVAAGLMSPDEATAFNAGSEKNPDLADFTQFARTPNVEEFWQGNT
jgi:hypothetical protein